MQTIFKYPFKTTDNFEISMPKDATILTVATQNESPCMWALVTPDVNEKQIRKFRVFGTGHPIDTALLYYIGTYQLQGGALVFHVFEILA
jgi:hypothetical protein